MSDKKHPGWPPPSANPVNETGQETDPPKPGSTSGVAIGGFSDRPRMENVHDQAMVAEEQGHPMPESDVPLP